MHDAMTDLFDIDVMLKFVCGGSQVLGDCVTGLIVERQVDYMVEGVK
jgi:hypothetical protein